MKSPIQRNGVLRVFRFSQGNGKRLDLSGNWEQVAERLTKAQPYSSSRPAAKEDTGVGWIDTDLYYAGNYAAFLWGVTKRKVPRSAVEELLEARLRSLGLEKVSRKMRTELKEDVTQELLQRALPDKKEHIAALDRTDATLFVQGLSLKHARSLANWVRRNLQDCGFDVGVPMEVLAELPAAVVDRFGTLARAESVCGNWKLQFDSKTAVVADSRGSVRVSGAIPVLGEEEEIDAAPQQRESLLDAELQVNEDRQIVGCKVETFDGNGIFVARYVFSLKKPPVVGIAVSTVGLGAQLIELISAWEWVYEQIRTMLQSDVRLHVTDKEHEHQVSILLRPYAD